MIRSASKPHRLSAEQRAELAQLARRAKEIKAKVSAARKSSLKAERRERERGQAKAKTEGQRQPRDREPRHLRFVKSLPCIATLKTEGVERFGCDPAHVRFSSVAHGVGNPGAGAKPDDWRVVPLTRENHEAQHARGDEEAWWADLGVGPYALARELKAVSGDRHAARTVLYRHAGRPLEISE